ncbi:ZIP family metal transporter [Alkalilimnicola sp. S0819]|uniref:ZIP family metal transporter n=1 Tax=Alkalilimnicola sp. S0819 TaxID=2613922 RepID=UPI00126271CB|nr:divalent cation transporter [Alkalilimnicola sp. S0819]KAB7624067.1 divalent cation transporter [Alkalilimnicola sp. S0819]MPQ16317.1 divalent cation transporter [Alkalilimnicola sp. S0819]
MSGPNLWQLLLYGLCAGGTVPLGAALAGSRLLLPRWLEQELRHGVIAFGGGLLLAAVALVLVPEGLARLSVTWAALVFLAGGLCFFVLDAWLERRGGSAAQLMALLLDFVPEALAMGAMAAHGQGALLLALLIALQNLPEGFNAAREMRCDDGLGQRPLLLTFSAIALLGPLAAALGFLVLAPYQALTGGLMLFAAAGILYLTFQDIAPEARLRRHWAPPLGAVLGFCVAMVGVVLLR